MRRAIAILITLFMIPMCCPLPGAEDMSDTSRSKDFVYDYNSTEYIYNLIRYLYRWYLDEMDIEKNSNAMEIEVYTKALHPKLDEGDKSRYAEVLIPMFDISVKLKESNYKIEELKESIRSNGFKIIGVSRVQPCKPDLSEYKKINVDIEKLREYLFRSRNKLEYPSDELLDRIKSAFKKDIVYLKAEVKNFMPEEGVNIIHLAPLSPVGNDVWAYWENGRLLLQCSSNIDISNKDVWEHEELYFHFYDLYDNIVVSLSEAASSNQFLTRDQAGRALYNCMVLGKRVLLVPDKQ